MAFTVEDGTGLSNSNSYLSEADADTFHSDRGNTAWAALASADKQAALINASSYIDIHYRFNGTKLLATQAMEFPRSGLVDWSGNTVTGLPQRLKDAVADLALTASTTNLTPALPRGGAVKSQKVDVISITFQDGAPATTSFSSVDQYLAPYINDVYDPTNPVSGRAASPRFQPQTGVELPAVDNSFTTGFTDYN